RLGRCPGQSDRVPTDPGTGPRSGKLRCLPARHAGRYPARRQGLRRRRAGDQPLLAAGKTPVIPPKSQRKVPRDYDRELYEARHLIENFFCKLKQFRAIATRYDKRAINFLAGVYAASILIWLN